MTTITSHGISSTTQAEFQVPRMKCGGCAATITAAIKVVDPQAHVAADPASKLVTVQSRASAADLRNALANAGFPPQ